MNGFQITLVNQPLIKILDDLGTIYELVHTERSTGISADTTLGSTKQ